MSTTEHSVLWKMILRGMVLGALLTAAASCCLVCVVIRVELPSLRLQSVTAGMIEAYDEFRKIPFDGGYFWGVAIAEMFSIPLGIIGGGIMGWLIVKFQPYTFQRKIMLALIGGALGLFFAQLAGLPFFVLEFGDLQGTRIFSWLFGGIIGIAVTLILGRIGDSEIVDSA